MRFSTDLISRLRSATHVAVFTGAGVSAESGIPTFRDRQSGLWQNFDAQSLATPEAFERDPAFVWGWYEWRRARVLASQPNAAHRAIALLAERVPRLTLITCYPFNYVGSAPKRLVVVAEPLSARHPS